MKNILFTLTILLFSLPIIASAHGGMMIDPDDISNQSDILQYMEDSALGDDLHEEMETLMNRMFADQSLGSSRINSNDYGHMGYGYGWNMMGNNGLSSVFGNLILIIWLIAGIMAIIWLGKKIKQ